MRAFLHGFLLTLILFFATKASSGTLILIVDKSASIRENEDRLMVESYQKALTELSILNGVHVEVIFFADEARIIGSGTASEVAVAFSQRPDIGTNTCLEAALSIVVDNFDSYAKPVVIDISADGEANCKFENLIPSYLDQLQERGAVINTLFVVNSNNIIDFPDWTRGVDSFSIVAESYYDFEEAIFEKLAREIAFIK